MKKQKPPQWQHFLILSALLIIICAIHGCKKDKETSINDQNAKINMTLKIQQWLIQHKVDTASSSIVNSIIKNGQWNTVHSINADSGKVYEVVELKSDSVFDDTTKVALRYFTLLAQKDTTAQIFEIYGYKNEVSGKGDIAIKDFDRTSIANLSGEITLYSWKNSFQKSKTFVNGVNTKILQLQRKPTLSKNVVQSVGKKVNDCDDWYWVTYSTSGAILDVQYAYTLCYCDQEQGFRDKKGVLRVKANCGTGGDGDSGPTTGPASNAPDPCKGKAAVNAMSSSTTVANQDRTILNNTHNSGYEYGANQRVSSWPNGSFINTPVATDPIPSTDTWTPTFTWDSQNGYTLGFSHGHPGDSGPSPDDIFVLLNPLSNTNLINAGQSAIDYYKNNAFSNTETTTGSYVVTVTDYQTLANIKSYSFTGQQAQDSFNAQYSGYVQDYLNNNAGASNGAAGAYAILMIFGRVVNVYYSPNSTSEYKPIIIDTQTNALVTTNCPN